MPAVIQSERPLRIPERIRPLADDHLAPLADAMIADEYQPLWLLQQSATHVDETSHWVQWDAPEAVAHTIECVLQ